MRTRERRYTPSSQIAGGRAFKRPPRPPAPWRFRYRPAIPFGQVASKDPPMHQDQGRRDGVVGLGGKSPDPARRTYRLAAEPAQAAAGNKEIARARDRNVTSSRAPGPAWRAPRRSSLRQGGVSQAARPVSQCAGYGGVGT